ncbi:Mrp/NBP35 family ATP-binding protein [Clostridia bacterium]|nr:Mrp/NBP35 family ATP-binding protein [Clostridia bacterium]
MDKNIKHVIAVASGKGGVGKSSATSLLAATLAHKGYKVGVMDADITGPSIPKIFGVAGHPDKGENGFIDPVMSDSGVLVMSINLLLEDASQPVIWRGPLVGKIVGQFFNEVNWGELDFLLIDMPPGTGDVPLTVLQSCDVEGVVMVTTPQDLAGMVVGKAVHMAEKMDKKVIGIIENMSYAMCPECGTKIEIFGKGHGEELANKFNLPVLGRVPIDPEFTRLSDEGKIHEYQATPEILSIVEQVEKFVG